MQDEVDQKYVMLGLKPLPISPTTQRARVCTIAVTRVPCVAAELHRCSCSKTALLYNTNSLRFLIITVDDSAEIVQWTAVPCWPASPGSCCLARCCMTAAAQTPQQRPQLLLQRQAAGLHACHTMPLLLQQQHMRQAGIGPGVPAGRLRCICGGVVAALL